MPSRIRSVPHPLTAKIEVPSRMRSIQQPLTATLVVLNSPHSPTTPLGHFQPRPSPPTDISGKLSEVFGSVRKAVGNSRKAVGGSDVIASFPSPMHSLILATQTPIPTSTASILKACHSSQKHTPSFSHPFPHPCI